MAHVYVLECVSRYENDITSILSVFGSEDRALKEAEIFLTDDFKKSNHHSFLHEWTGSDVFLTIAKHEVK